MAGTGVDELRFWHAYEEEYGIPDGYFVAGLVAQVVALVNGNAGATVADFVPYFRAQARPQTGEEMLFAFRGATAHLPQVKVGP